MPRGRSAPAVGVGAERAPADLDRDLSAELRVAGAVDLAHAARAERASNFVQDQFARQ